MITIAETEQFQKKVKQLLTEDEKNALISYLSLVPTECLCDAPASLLNRFLLFFQRE